MRISGQTKSWAGPSVASVSPFIKLVLREPVYTYVQGIAKCEASYPIPLPSASFKPFSAPKNENFCAHPIYNVVI